MVEFESSWSRRVGDKDAAIRLAFGITPSRYYELLDELIDLPEAFIHAPATFTRYRRLRDVRDLRQAALR
ncbi:MAG: DUF3263 domain-containing protein [Actinomycetales bacterium]|nr:DUF3263 domain-containing protein [Actinomycetales bacterium]